ncbi:hypothetical protein [Desulfonatronovibrio magnus]|uniref:hypothetical protein n=1 Tax=Desulfonatronovibrio magnus TaxID=698827 RepID=UPI0018DD7250|nr:hypothetical protein [Desulfonatronovibrio magnus]
MEIDTVRLIVDKARELKERGKRLRIHSFAREINAEGKSVMVLSGKTGITLQQWMLMSTLFDV